MSEIKKFGEELSTLLKNLYDVGERRMDRPEFSTKLAKAEKDFAELKQRIDNFLTTIYEQAKQ